MPSGLRSALRSLPLQRRVAYLTTVAVALAVAISSVAAYVTIRVSLYNALDNELINTATSLAKGPVTADIRALGGLTEASLRAENVSLAAVRADGERYFVPDERERLVLGDQELAIARTQLGNSVRSGVSTSGEEYRIVAVPVPGLANYALVLGRPLEPTNDILSSLWVVLIIFGSLGVIAAGVVGATVARSSLRPVRQLSAAVEHVTVTKELTPIKIDATGDIASLAESFNQMLTSLASSRERQAQLLADAGHELRTPLTSLRTNIDLLAADATSGILKRGRPGGHHGRRHRPTGRVHRPDRGPGRPGPGRDLRLTRTLDFRDVVTAALERVRRRGHGLQFDVELNPFYVVGDSDMLERAVTNLLDNAVKWSPPVGSSGSSWRAIGCAWRIRVRASTTPTCRTCSTGSTAPTPPATPRARAWALDRREDRHSARRLGAGRPLAQGGAEFTVQLPGSASEETLLPQPS